MPVNGMVEGLAFPSLSVSSPPSPSWVPMTTFYRTGLGPQPSPRSTATDSSPGALSLSDMASSTASPSVSPGPGPDPVHVSAQPAHKTRPGLLGKVPTQPGDSSEGSEDLERGQYPRVNSSFYSLLFKCILIYVILSNFF